VRYELTLLRDRVVVTRVDSDAADAADDLRRAFERFGPGTARRRMPAGSEELAATSLEAQVLRQVARLHPEAFDALASFVRRYPDPIDPTVARFDREVQFYLAVLHHVDRWRRSGIAFCYPEVTDRGHAREDRGHGRSDDRDQADGAAGGERERVVGAVDLALADRLLVDGATVVPNGYQLAGPERVLVVTGANQGGKTTFARTVGQLHVLAALGCPVAAREARLALADRVLTLFEREEDLRDLRGKLQDELVRARELLAQATPASLAIVNEAVSATTAADALQVGRRVLRRLLDVGALGVWVTFVDELASMDPAVVSMVCGVDPADPTRRTFELTRRPADGRAYAVAIARAHGLTYDELRRKLAP
jgi:DNA mismatch repair protein MutS